MIFPYVDCALADIPRKIPSRDIKRPLLSAIHTSEWFSLCAMGMPLEDSALVFLCKQRKKKYREMPMECDDGAISMELF